MDVTKVLQNLVKYDRCLPAIKLAWNSELDLQDNEDIPSVAPSHYKSEISLTTEERYSLLCRQQRKLELHWTDFDILAIPSIVVFQNYKIGQKATTKLGLCNVGKQLQKATFFMEETYGFSIDERCNRIVKFAPGMTATISINFTPNSNEDFYHKLIISTRTSRFAIPIVCIGTRGFIDIPDVFDFGKVPVRVLKKQTVVGFNSGSETARFSLSTDGPFTIKPERGIVAAKDTFTFEVSFLAEYRDIYEGFVCIKYDNDEEVHSTCKAIAVDADIFVEPKEVIFDSTYTGLMAKSTITLYNNSDEIVDFKWKKHFSHADDANTFRKSVADMMQIQMQMQMQTNWKTQGLTNHMRRKYSTEVPHLEDSFFSENCILEPQMGKIQPRSSMQVLAVFKPSHHYEHKIEAFLNVAGVQDPIRVVLKGLGLGPAFKLAFEELDVGVVYMGGSHLYEIGVTNIGQIEGMIKFDKILTRESKVPISVQPDKLVLAPDHYGAFYVKLTADSSETGDIFCDLKFFVPKSGESHFVRLSGELDFPKMHFSLPELYFGNVGYGSPKCQQVLLINDSLNTLSIHLRIDEDGTEEPMDIEKIIEIYKDPQRANEIMENANPREFTIEPSMFILKPRGYQRIEVTLCANECRPIHTDLLCCIADERYGETTPMQELPIRGRCKAPILYNGDPELHLKNAFVFFANAGEFQLMNESDVPACYRIVPLNLPKVRCESENFVGVAKARGNTIVPFTMTSNILGDSSMDLDVYTLGNPEKLFSMTVKCTCSPAKLNVKPKNVDFGSIDVLQPYTQTIDVINDSPLTFPFRISLVEGGKYGDEWTFEPVNGIIDPEGRQTVEIQVILKDHGEHQAVIRIHMNETTTYLEVKLCAVGIGTSLYFEPPLEYTSELNFGTMFTKTEKVFTVDVTNKGHSVKVLEWVHSEDDPPLLDKKDLPKRLSSSPASKRKASIKPQIRKELFVFTIVPKKKILQPGATLTITFTAQSILPQTVAEVYNLWIYTPKEPEKSKDERRSPIVLPVRKAKKNALNQKPFQSDSSQPILAQSVRLLGDFEVPALIFSKQQMLFQINAFPDQTDFIQEDVLKVENKGALPLTGVFQTKFPFCMKLKYEGMEDLVTEWSHTFQPSEQIFLTLSFDGQHLRKDRGSFYFDSALKVFYEEYPQSESIALKGEVHFPQVQIDRDVFDIGPIENGTEALEEFSVTNPCNFCLAYKWYIKPGSTVIEYDPDDSDKLCFELECDQNIRTRSKKPGSRKQKKGDKCSRKRISKNDNDLNNAKNLQSQRSQKRESLKLGIDESSNPVRPKTRRRVNSTQSNVSTPRQSRNSEGSYGKRSRSLKQKKERTKKSKPTKITKKKVHISKALDECGEWVQFVRNKYFRTKMMQMVGLHDAYKEKEDEMHYLNYAAYEPETINNVAISQLIDIIPLGGIIQAGQTQRFMLVFYGNSNIRLKTTAICHIEGGTSRIIEITAQSMNLPEESPPALLVSPSETVEADANDQQTVIGSSTSDKTPVEGVEFENATPKALSVVAVISNKFKHRCMQRQLRLAHKKTHTHGHGHGHSHGHARKTPK